MAIAKITGQGLLAITLSVVALWGCILSERVTMRQAKRERAQVVREIYRLRQRAQQPQPASAPKPKLPRPTRAILG